MDCNSVGNELATLVLKEGWYRPKFESREAYQCGFELACIGGNGTKLSDRDGTDSSEGGDENEPWLTVYW